MAFQGFKSGAVFSAPRVSEPIIARARQGPVVGRESDRPDRLVGVGGGVFRLVEARFGVLLELLGLLNRFLPFRDGLPGFVGRFAGQLQFRFSIGFCLLRFLEFLVGFFQGLGA